MAFNCEFDAPQFFDFQEIAAVGGPDALHAAARPEDVSMAERYFAVDHEMMQEGQQGQVLGEDFPGAGGEDAVPVSIPVDYVENPQEVVVPTAKDDNNIPPPPAASSSSTSPPSSLVQRMRQRETPKRRSLRDAVAKTLGNVANSPKIELPATNRRTMGGETPSSAAASSTSPQNPETQVEEGGSGGSGGGARRSGGLKTGSKLASPAVARWKRVVQALTPDIVRKARMMRSNQQQLKLSRETSKDALASSHRLAATATLASQARENEVFASKQPLVAAAAAAATHRDLIRQKMTRPNPFNFATDARVHLQGGNKRDDTRTKPSRPLPMKPSEDNVDFSKMLRNYETTAAASRHPLSSVSSAASGRSNRRRSNSCSSGLPFGVGSSVSSISSLNSLNSTKPQPFSFVDRDLAKVKERSAREQVHPPMDFYKNLRSYPSGESLHEVGLTDPKPFSFANRPPRRRTKSVDLDALRKVDDRSRVIKAKPAPHFGIPVVLPSMSKATVLQPFSFDVRDQGMTRRKEEKMQKVLEQERMDREFRANPMPDVSKPIGLPIKEVVLPTEPQPFNLEIERRADARVQKWRLEVEEELRQKREAANFKANPATVLHREPFVPQKSDKPLVEVSNFELHSDKRARDREVYEMGKKQHEAELAAMKLEMEERRRLEEDQEVRRMRRDNIHRPQPILPSRPIQIHPSEKPLTEPMSPNFSQRRIKQQQQQQDAPTQ